MPSSAPGGAWLLAVLLAATPSLAAAQGPLTEGAARDEPTGFAFRLGPLLATPRFIVRELGVDTNVFDDPDDPVRDFVATVAPDLQWSLRTEALRITATTGADFTYYRDHTEERGIDRQIRARADVLLGRLQPWVSGAFVETRDRLNAELDRRARRHGAEFGGGVGVNMSPVSRVYVAGARTETRFEAPEASGGLRLADALDRTSDLARLGLLMRLTPFTTLTVDGGVQRDRFVQSPSRDSDSRIASAQLEFSPDAIIRGRARVGYRDFDPADPALGRYRGLTALAGVRFAGIPSARLDVDATRDVEYSFDEGEGYFIQSGVLVTYTNHLFGPWDAQVRAGRRWLDYRRPGGGAAERRPGLDTYAAGVGYNLHERSRVGVTYEYVERGAPTGPGRRFDRRRIYGSWTYEF